MPDLTTVWLRAVHDAGLGGTVLRAALAPLSCLYAGAVLAYRAAYAVGLRRTIQPALPTISVGSLAVGGAGKTTVAAFLADRFSAAGCRPAIVLRGYGRRGGGEVVVVSVGSDRLVDVADCGDEAAMLADRCRGAVVVVGRRREAAIEAAAARGARVAILDDGFEYFRLKRDLDVLLVNLLQFGPAMRVLPAGILRDPPRLLQHAGQVWFTYAGVVAPETVAAAEAWVKRWAPDVPIVGTHHRIVALRHVAGQAPAAAAPSPVAAFCGIGSPAGFEAALREFGVKLAGFRAFPDHHWYSGSDICELAAWAQSMGARAAVTTGKDAVRLGTDKWPPDGPPLMVADLALDVLWGAEAIQEAVKWFKKGCPPKRSDAKAC